MDSNQCLYCYQPLLEVGLDYHKKCSKKIFGLSSPPLLPYHEGQINELAKEVVRSQFALTGVQAKLSLDVVTGDNLLAPKRFTIVGLWGQYILEPQSSFYPYLPELEDLTMHLAELSGIATVPHTLIRLGNSMAYLTKRVDRVNGQKLHMEDMCQLTEKLTEEKYRGSYEQIGKVIAKHSAHPGLDLVNFYEQLVFSFLTGNTDMHLKNFSLLKTGPSNYTLCPAYDLVATALVIPDDKDELALNLNGKKRKLQRKDFLTSMGNCGILPKACENILKGFSKSLYLWQPFIQKSFLPKQMKDQYWELIENKASQIGVI